MKLASAQGRGVPLVLAGLGLVAGCNDDPKTKPLDPSERILDPKTCEECHPTHYREWLGSMHAYAGEDPVFRAMNERGQRETNGELGDFCVRCHAPLAVELGLTTDGLDLDEVPQHLRGITCFYCHTVDAVEGTHNNPLVLAMRLAKEYAGFAGQRPAVKRQAADQQRKPKELQARQTRFAVGVGRDAQRVQPFKQRHPLSRLDLAAGSRPPCRALVGSP